MQEPDHNRMEPKPQLKRKRGRPRKHPLPDDPPTLGEPEEATPILHSGAIFPIICPLCGRGMTPKVDGKRENGDRRCRCSLCGGKFEYRPPQVRRYGNS